MLDQPLVAPLMVGRAAQFDALTHALQAARTGAGQMILIAGEAGIGKSRLARETAAQAASSGFLVLQGQCFEPDRPLPYAPFLDLLRPLASAWPPAALLAALGPTAQDLAALLPEASGWSTDSDRPASLEPQHQKRRLFQALTAIFTHLAASQPLLVVVEDLHWSDDTSLELLGYLARDLRAQPVLLLATYRSDEVHPALAHALATLDRQRLAAELRLARLSVVDLDLMLRALLGLQRSVHAEFLHIMYSLTEGNPFFVEEIVRSLLGQGELRLGDDAWDRARPTPLRIPRSIQDAVTRRSVRLSAGARRALELAAVAGRRFDFELLQTLLEHDERELLALVKELIASYLVVEESAERFAFRHALTRQAIYEQMLARERRALHRQIAAALERRSGAAETHVEDLAYHWHEAGAWAETLAYAQRAAERAQALHAPRSTIEQVTRALEAVRHLGTAPPPRLYWLRGHAYELLGEFAAARSDYEAALQRSRETVDRPAEWQTLLDLGLFWSGHDYARAGHFFEQALALARQLGDPAALGRSLNRLGNWHLNVEQPVEARRYHDQALAIFETLNDRPGIAETLDLLGMACLLGADASGSAAFSERAAALFRELEDRPALAESLCQLANAGGAFQFDTGIPAPIEPADAIRYGERALSITREIGSRAGEAFALLNLACPFGWWGEYGRAFELARAALAIAEQIEHQQWRTYAHWLLGALHLDLSALSEARDQFEAALALARAVGSQHWLREASAFAAAAAVLEGELDRAAALLAAASTPDSPMQTMGQRQCWYARAELALARGNAAQALETADRLIASAPGPWGAPTIPRLSLLRARALAALQRPGEAEQVLAAAENAVASHGVRPLLWRIRIARGNLARSRGSREAAETLFSAARATVEELAATVPDLGLRDHFLRAALALLPPSRPPSPLQAAKRAFGGLTARERQVAERLAAGRSNRAIADELVLSERTVEKHVASILDKLGLTSRAQVAAWAVKVGLARDTR